MENKKTCQNCKSVFTIEPEDFTFYEHIQVPPPTWCPQCRFQRRMSWRNGWHLFKKKDARTGEEILSLYPPGSYVKIYERDFWWSDGWDPMQYGRDYDFNRPFFEQYAELLREVPFPAHSVLNLNNCRFCTNAADLKNCYLVRAATYSEDCAYLIWDHASRQCMDSHMTDHCELSYGNLNTEHCYRTVFSVDCADCQEMILCKDCVGCHDCVGCFGLRSKQYCIFNEQYTKDEYKKRLAEMNFGSYARLIDTRHQSHEFWKTKPHKYMYGFKNSRVSGEYIYESKNAKNCYRVRGVEDGKYCQNILNLSARDCYDYSNFGENAELIYESLIIGRGASNIKFCIQSYLNVKNLEYCIFCVKSSDLFGCVSLQNKQYCILNKQYAPDEYKTLVSKIKLQMIKTGEYGEFFPAGLSPFPYRISEAYEFFPMTQKEAQKKGFAWYEIAKQKYAATLPASQLPDSIADAKDELINEAIGCAHDKTCDHECTGAFRIIQDEIVLCRRLNIPLPRLCQNCRYYELIKLRNSAQIYNRQCAKCGQEIKTSYAPDRPEIVYCERCYQQEVV